MFKIFNEILVSCITINPVYKTTYKDFVDYKPSIWYKTVEVFPEYNNLPDDSTLFYLGFVHSDTLLVFLKAYQKSEIAASILKNDQEDILNDDWILIMLDTEGKGNTAYAFQANPIGTKRDFIVSEGGDNVIEWDGDWRVKVNRTEYGYNMLFMIPLNSITFVEGLWGLRVERFIAGKGELQVLCNTGSFQSLSNIAKIQIDFSRINMTPYSTQSKELFDISPSFFVRAYRFRETGNSPYYSLKYGGNIRIKKGNSTLFDITLRPDFSDIEADIQEIPVNRKPIFYPEKRPFFMEGRALLETPINLVRTRNFESINKGVKFYSKSKRFSTILFLMEDSIFDTLSFGKISFSPKRNYELGIQYVFSPSNYKFLTLDSYLPLSLRQSTGIKIQATHREDVHSTLLFGSIYKRSEFQGLNMNFEFMHIDKHFLTPLSSLYFDDINYVSLNASYGKSMGKEIYVKPAISYFTDRSASSDTLVDEYMEGSLIFSKRAFSSAIIYQREYMPYLNIDVSRAKKKYFYMGGSLNYALSSYKSLEFTLLKGKYLDFNSYLASVKLKTTPIRNLNLGFKFDRIGFTNTDAMPEENLFQIFGIVSLFKNNLIIKPYFGYHKVNEQVSLFTKQIAYLNISKLLKIYGVFVFEKTKDDEKLLYQKTDHTIKLVLNF